MVFRKSFVPVLVASLVVSLTAHADETDLLGFNAVKAYNYWQSSTSTPTEASGAWTFYSAIAPTTPTSLVNPTLDAPGIPGIAYSYFGAPEYAWIVTGTFDTQSEMDTLLANGTYTFNIPTTSGPAQTFTPTLDLVGDIYTSDTPTITNTSWADGVLVLNTDVDNLITWNSFTDQLGLFSGILLKLGDTNYGPLVTDTSFNLLGGTLAPQQYYDCYIAFINIADADNSIPGITGLSGYGTYTKFTLFAVPEPSTYAMATLGLALSVFLKRRKSS